MGGGGGGDLLCFWKKKNREQNSFDKFSAQGTVHLAGAPTFVTNSLAGEHYDCHTRDLLQNFLNEAAG